MKNEITTATIFLTQNCNFNCHHCLNKCPYNEEISLNEYRDLIVTLKEYGLQYIILTGGEPTIHKNFEEIIDFTTKEQIYFKVISNGYLYERYGPFLLRCEPYFRKISFSVEGMRENNDNNRRKGSFDRVVEAVKYFKDKGIYVGINFTITKQSYQEYEKLVEFFAKLEIDEIHLGAVIGNGSNQDMVLDAEKRESVFWNIPRLMKKHKVKITLGSSLYNYGGVEFCSVLSNYRKIFINQHAQLIYCCNIEEKFARVSYDQVTKSNLKNLIEARDEITQRIRTDRLMRLLFEPLTKTEEYTCEYCNSFFQRFLIAT